MNANYTDAKFNDAIRATGLLTVRDVITQTGISPKTLSKHRRAGLITGHRRVILGRAMWLFVPSDVAAYAAIVGNLNAESIAEGRFKAGVRRPQAPDGYMSIQALATKSGWSEYFVRDRIDDGSLPTTRGAGNMHLISISDADRFIESHRAKLEERQRADYKGPPNQAITWTPDMLTKLGQVSDAQLASEFGVSITSVRSKRLSLGIDAYFPQSSDVQWTPAMDALLGKNSDAAVAAELNINARSVSRRRRALDIAAYDSNSSVMKIRHYWTAEDDALLGTMPDNKVAEKLGLHPISVFNRRHRIGVLSYRANKTGQVNITMKHDAKKFLLEMNEDLAAQIKLAEQVVLSRLAAAGVRFSSLPMQQVIEAAVSELASKYKEPNES